MNFNKNATEMNVFNESYLALTKELIENGNYESSRNGDTIEVLNFKTEIKNPLKRLVGGYRRNVNVFFLLQEAIWIWLGQKHVEPLAWFNENMRNFSDDGKTFHAPYGFRLRQYGLPSDSDLFEKLNQEQNRVIPVLPNQGIDQIRECLILLSENSQDRRVVASIWNPILDLNFKCKDLPCNDMLMFKIRDGKLHLTIQNRSNDLHWGLPTNVFQFSFILEMMSHILKVKMGTQTHNSQSLHVYLNNPITLTMLNKGSRENAKILYGKDTNEEAHLFDFSELANISGVLERLQYIDQTLELAYRIICQLAEEIEKVSPQALELQLKELKQRSVLLAGVVKLLYSFLRYKAVKGKTDKHRKEAILYILSINELPDNNDFKIMAINFFITRLSNKEDEVFKNTIGDKSLLLLDY